MDDHAATYAAESMPPTVWERWINDVEALLSVSADGDGSSKIFGGSEVFRASCTAV